MAKQGWGIPVGRSGQPFAGLVTTPFPTANKPPTNKRHAHHPRGRQCNRCRLVVAAVLLWPSLRVVLRASQRPAARRGRVGAPEVPERCVTPLERGLKT